MAHATGRSTRSRRAGSPAARSASCPSTERPRERLALRGAAGLTAAELIGLVWGSGTRGRSAVDLAEDALARHDGLTGLARASGRWSSRRCPASARPRRPSSSAAFELGRRLLADWPAGRWTIRARATSPTG